MFLPHPRVKVSIVGSLRDREVACSASDRQGSNFESCVWRTVSSQSSHHPQEVLLAQFSLYVHKGGLKPDSFHFIIQVFLSSVSHPNLTIKQENHGYLIVWNILSRTNIISYSLPNTYPESPVFPKYTIQRKNKLHYGTTKSEKENEQPVLDVHFSDTADKDKTPIGKLNKSHEISNKEDEDLHRSPKDCSRLRGLEQKLQETTDKNTKLVKQIRGLRQQSMRQRKDNIKLIKGRDSLMTEKIKMRKEITRLEQKLEKANQNRPNKNEKKVTFKENEIDDNDNAWGTVGATKSKNSIKTRTAVNTCAKATPTKGQKVIENKNRKKTNQTKKHI